MTIIKEHEFIIKEIESIGEVFIKNPPDSKDALIKCCRGFLDRLYVSLTNAKLLINIQPYNSQILYGLSIILRTVMADAIFAADLFHEAEECSSDMNFNPFTDKCLELLGDGVSNSYSYLQRLKTVQHELDIDTTFKAIEDELKDLYNYNQSNFKKAKPNITNILSSQNYEDFHRHFDTFYTMFSKVEHFGLIYFKWLDTLHNIKEESINKAIRTLMLHYFNILRLLFVSNHEHEFIIQKITGFKIFSDNN